MLHLLASALLVAGSVSLPINSSALSSATTSMISSTVTNSGLPAMISGQPADTGSGPGFNASTPYNQTTDECKYCNSSSQANRNTSSFPMASLGANDGESANDDADAAVLRASLLSVNGSNGAINTTAPMFTTTLIVANDKDDNEGDKDDVKADDSSLLFNGTVPPSNTTAILSNSSAPLPLRSLRHRQAVEYTPTSRQ